VPRALAKEERSTEEANEANWMASAPRKKVRSTAPKVRSMAPKLPLEVIDALNALLDEAARKRAHSAAPRLPLEVIDALLEKAGANEETREEALRAGKEARGQAREEKEDEKEPTAAEAAEPGGAGRPRKAEEEHAN